MSVSNKVSSRVPLLLGKLMITWLVLLGVILLATGVFNAELESALAAGIWVVIALSIFVIVKHRQRTAEIVKMEQRRLEKEYNKKFSS